MTDPQHAGSQAASSQTSQTSDASQAILFDWRWKAFDDLSPTEVYDILAARSAVFVVEQKCAYDDVDGLDPQAWHLCAYSTGGARPRIAGYLRVLLPGDGDADVRIGRVLTMPDFRGVGIGRAMMERALSHIYAQWPGVPIRLHAQAHLQAFYGAFGFEPVSNVHDDDGIPHVWMRSS
ncbi:GNAT family N-acetyltransferase [Paraburkholderia sp.]|uniref:GNAT family N-acetyltransferase n=1 Tax=Paraburkholderia sp. TaxID=1926495 RepID=UPI003D6E23DF